MTWKERLVGKRHENALTLNQASVALKAGNFDLAAEFARKVLESRRLPRNSRLTAEFVLIQTKSRQGHFAGVFDELDSLFRKVPKRNVGLQARVGNEIVWACFRSGNLGMGASKGEEFLRKESSNWSEVDSVELLCQLSSCHFHRGDTARAEELVYRALELAEKNSSPKALAQSLWQSSSILSDRGDLTLALQQAKEAKKWAEIAGINHAIPVLNHNAAVILLELPNTDLDLVQKLGELTYLDSTTQNFNSGAAYACEVLSEVALRRGDFKLALAQVERGLSEMSVEIPGPKTSLLVQVAKVLARMGNYEDSKVALARATDHMEKEEPSRELARQWGDIARVFVEVGLTDRGVYAYEKAIQMSGLLREEQDSYIS